MERARAKKKSAGNRPLSSHRTNNRVDDLTLTGRSFASDAPVVSARGGGSAANMEKGKLKKLHQSNRTPRTGRGDENLKWGMADPQSPTYEDPQRTDPVILMDGHELKISELYLMLKKKIIGRHPGGSHGIVRCWKQFRQLAGAGRVGGGGKGAGVVTKKELGVAFRNYGLPLDRSEDLDLIFKRFDGNKDGLIDLNDWLYELTDKWSSSVNTVVSENKIYEG